VPSWLLLSPSRPRRLPQLVACAAELLTPPGHRAPLLPLTIITMNPLRQAATRLTRPVFRTQIISRPTTAIRPVSTTPRFLAESTHATAPASSGDHASEHAEHGHGHESHYDPPGGWLWGERPGEKYEREGWEIPFYVMCAGYVVAVIAYTMKEDTS